MERYLYDAYGLTIDSTICCPELPLGRAPGDVYFRSGNVPPSIGAASQPALPYEATPGRFLLRIDGVARYLVARGERIEVENAPGAEQERVRLYLLGLASGVLLLQRGTLALHGSAIETPRGAIILTAPSRSGKSTLARAFMARGYRALSDDICAISFDPDGRPLVAPGYPQMKLWADAVALLEGGTESLQKVSGDRDKYIVPLANGFCPTAAPLHAVYVLEPGSVSDSGENGPVALHGAERFNALVRHTYRGEFLHLIGTQRSHFRNVAPATPV